MARNTYSTPYRMSSEREEDEKPNKKFTLSPFMHILIAALCFGMSGASCQICNKLEYGNAPGVSETGMGMALGFISIAVYVGVVGWIKSFKED